MGNRGMALVLALLALLALTALGHGTMLLARREALAANAFRRARGAEEASQVGLRLTLLARDVFDAPRQPGGSIPVTAGETPDGFSYRVELRWLDQELFLLESHGTFRGWNGDRRSAWVGWSLSPEARVLAFRAVAELGGTLRRAPAAEIDAGAPTSPPDGWSDTACAGVGPVASSVLENHGLGTVARLTDRGEAEPGEVEAIPRLGLLDGETLLDRAEGGVEGSLPPLPPGDSVTGCPGSGSPVFRVTEDNLTLEEERLCGLVVVAGDLRLAQGATFQGLALVGGDLILDSDALIEGLVRVGGDLVLNDEARLVASICPALSALEGSSELRDPVLIPGFRLGGF